MKSLILSLFLAVVSISLLDRTYYKALKIPISATQQQIKTAYRKLSRKYHPDRNPNAGDKFQKINVAYETLSNTENKYLYDRLGREKMNDPNIRNQVNLHELKGPDVQIPLSVTLQDLYNGKKLQGTIFKQMACTHCSGTGAQNQYDIVRCSECNGQGKKTKRVHVGGGYYNMINQKCNRCKGEGKIIGRKCQTCSGNKIISGSQNFVIEIQPGTRNYETKRFINMGDQKSQGAPGDVIVLIKQVYHPRFTRVGDELHANIWITLSEALFGFQQTIIQLDGRQLKVGKKTISQPNQIILVEGQGMPIKGTDKKSDMLVRINIKIPEYNTKQLEKLRQTFNNF